MYIHVLYTSTNFSDLLHNLNGWSVVFFSVLQREAQSSLNFEKCPVILLGEYYPVHVRVKNNEDAVMKDIKWVITWLVTWLAITRSITGSVPCFCWTNWNRRSKKTGLHWYSCTSLRHFQAPPPQAPPPLLNKTRCIVFTWCAIHFNQVKR